MLLHTQFTSRDRVPVLEGCYLILGTFPIGNLTPGPRNLVFADRFFHTSHWGFLFLLGFPLYKITTKSKWRLQRKTVLEDGFSKIRKSTHIFLPFKSESRLPVDRVMVHSRDHKLLIIATARRILVLFSIFRLILANFSRPI